MALSVAQWMYDRKHKGEGDRRGIGEYHDGSFQRWSHTRSDQYPFHYRDGVRIWVSKYDLDPDGDWV